MGVKVIVTVSSVDISYGDTQNETLWRFLGHVKGRNVFEFTVQSIVKVQMT